MAVAHNSAAGSPRRPSPPRLSAQRATAKLCAATQPSSPPLLALVFGADAQEGVALVAARRRKVARYPELTRGGPQRLVVFAAEVWGRWSDECQQFLRSLLRLRAQRAPPPLRCPAAQGWARRWWSVLSVALQPAASRRQLRAWSPDHAAAAWCARRAPVG